MTVHQISLNDCLTPSSPPEKVLSLSVVEDTAFVSINACSGQGDKIETQTVTADIAVSLASLREALALLGNDRARESLRQPDGDHGDRASGLTGQRLVIVPV